MNAIILSIGIKLSKIGWHAVKINESINLKEYYELRRNNVLEFLFITES